ncbi:ATP-binding cassette domain-containing protein [Marinomonas sp. C2222]|uniref:ATP-binding cassette domain-containing protein n=1 Tax=Marinomonas sargassi TaxID=2984494 RepID=A0ABT2YRS2_9GAMM|nr:ATP-binding cassette domain-containing protein [Marinomonas sargassi]MCV2402593.1 ATP-binding cassette domain-containing protein [Marinomonas sargassi]
MKKTNKLSLKSLIFSNLWGFMVPVFLGLVASLAGVALLGVSGWFISAAGLATALGAHLSFNYLTPGAIVRGLAIFRTAGRYGEQVSAHNHLLGLLRTLRLWVWDRRVEQDATNLQQQSKGDLLQRLVNDLDMIIRWPLVVFLPWLYALLSYVAMAVFAYFLQADLLYPIAVCGFFHLLIIPYLAGHYARQAVHIGQVLGVYRRSRFVSVFSALITLTIRGHWQEYAQRLGYLDEKQKIKEAAIQNAVSAGRLGAYCVTIMLLVVSFYVLAFFDSESQRWSLVEGVKGTWVVGFVLAVLALNELVLPLAQAFVAQGQSQVGLHRLNQLQTSCTSSTAKTAHDDFKVHQLSFKQWHGFHAVNGMGNKPLDLDIYLGDRLWICGSSGSGKSTLLAAMAGDCLSKGEVFVNGDKCDLFGNETYQKQVSYLPQSPYVFQQSVAANLRLGKEDATEDELWEVLEAVALAEWARALPNGLATLLSFQGRDLSGGQRKRLVLARLLLRNVPVLLLDEPFDGLDTASIRCISHALQHDFRPNILVLVSHVSSSLGDSAKKIEL